MMTANKNKIMKLFGIIKQMVKEAKNRKNEYACTMLYFKFPELVRIHNQIDPEDIYNDPEDPSFGLETEPHTTLLFGTHEGVPVSDIKSVLDGFTFSTCKVYNASLFKNDKYDVLKFDVKGENLHNANKALQQFPFTSNFPDYHPHLTIAYLKPGTGEKYTRLLKNIEYELVPLYAVYSEPDGKKPRIRINVD